MRSVEGLGRWLSRAVSTGAAVGGVLGAMVAGCADTGAPSREATGSSLAPSTPKPGSGVAGGRQLIGEFIGSFDPATKQISIVPATERNDALGLTGEAATWSLGASSILTIATPGAYYIDHTGKTQAQGTYTSTMAGSSGSAPCLYTGNTCSGSACLAATCALVTLASSVSFSEVDLEVSGLTTGVTVQHDDKSAMSSTNGETTYVDTQGLGVWRWPSGVTSTATQHTPATSPLGVAWQFDTATTGLAWSFGVRAWKLLDIALAFSTTPIALSTTAGSSTTGTLTLTNSGGTTTNSALTESTSSSGSANITITSGGDGCATHTLAGGGSCTVGITLTCPAGVHGSFTNSFTYTDAIDGLTATGVVNGTCTGGKLQVSPTTITEPGTVGDGGDTSGGAVTMTNTTAGTTGTITRGTLVGSAAAIASISFAGSAGGSDDCDGKALKHKNDTCAITPAIVCTAASPGSFTVTVPYTDTNGDSTSFIIDGTCAGLSVSPTSTIALSAVVETPTTGTSASGTVATITNASSTATGVVTVATSGVADITFSGCAGTSILGTSSCTVTPTLTCTTSDYGTTLNGTASATNTATYTDPTSGNTVAVTVSGNCNPLQANVATSASSPDFLGSAATSGTITLPTSVTITNVATASGTTTAALAATITSTGGTGTWTAASGSTCSTGTEKLAPGGSCTFQPKLACGTATGLQTATFTFTDSKSGDSVVFYASAMCSSLSFSPTTIFVDAAVGASATGETSTLTNLTSTAITSGHLTGPTYSPTVSGLTVTDNCGGALAGSGTCTITPHINCTGIAAGTTLNTTATYTDTVNSTTASVAVTGFCGTYQEMIVAAGPVAYWPLDDAASSSPTVSELIAGNNGTAMAVSPPTYTALPTFAQTPLITTGDSMLFNGREKVQVPYLSAVNPTVNLSVECWINSAGADGISADGGYQSCITSRDDVQHPGDVQHGWIIYYNSTSQSIQFWTGNGTNGWSTVIDPATRASGTTYYVVGTYTSGTMYLYVNGALVGSNTAHYSPQTSMPLYIGMGSTETNGEYGFNGKVDEVTVYSYALSATQIAQHYWVGTH